ncbi:MAG: hypothetical protein PHI85_04070 [Victivallaceae bacterium]|nr:hypothetical protein [Victivallaceae bacterium]
MKTIIKKISMALVILITAMSVLLVGAFLFKPLGDVVFSVTIGSMYRKAGETCLKRDGKNETLTIYKANNKPFLIIGPCFFNEGERYEDFFFVNKKQVISTATDKGGDTWTRLFNRLFLWDDMSNCERVRAPYWDDLKCDKDSSVVFDKTTDEYIYSFKINSVTVPVSFSIPYSMRTGIDIKKEEVLTLSRQNLLLDTGRK